MANPKLTKNQQAVYDVLTQENGNPITIRLIAIATGKTVNGVSNILTALSRVNLAERVGKPKDGETEWKAIVSKQVDAPSADQPSAA